MSLRLTSAAVASALLLAIAAAPALAATTNAGDAADGTALVTPTRTPPRILPREVHGKAAIRALGSDLTSVARHNGFSAARLEQILSTDPTAWVSETGQMFYRDEPPTGEAMGSGTGTALAAAYPTSQTFALHSRPGASRQIYLDFNGVTLANSAWSTMSGNAIANGSYTGYDSDNNLSTFSDAEHAWIQEVWRRSPRAMPPSTST